MTASSSLLLLPVSRSEDPLGGSSSQGSCAAVPHAEAGTRQLVKDGRHCTRIVGFISTHYVDIYIDIYLTITYSPHRFNHEKPQICTNILPLIPIPTVSAVCHESEEHISIQ